MNKIMSNNKPRNTNNIKDDQMNSRNDSKISEVRKNLFPPMEINNHKKLNTIDLEDNFNNNKKREAMKKNIMEQCNGCIYQKENNYIFNLRFYNIYNNNDNENSNSKSNIKNTCKTKTRSIYSSKENINDEKKNNNTINTNKIMSPNKEKKKSKKIYLKEELYLKKST